MTAQLLANAASTPTRTRPGHPARQRTAGQNTYEQLRREILGLTLQPGTWFSEAETAARLQATKPAVREALARLRRDGLVESVPRSGHRVSPVTVKDARDLFALRTLLEGESAALAANHASQAGDLRRLEEACRAVWQPSDSVSIVAFLNANEEFHLAVARLGGNRRLTEQLAGVIEALQRYLHFGLARSLRSEQIVHQHEELLSAILQGDATTARAVAVKQATASHLMVVEALISSEAIQSTNLAASPPLARLR